jgi:hypothetical protein
VVDSPLQSVAGWVEYMHCYNIMRMSQSTLRRAAVSYLLLNFVIALLAICTGTVLRGSDPQSFGGAATSLVR